MATAPGDDGDDQLPTWTPDVTDEQLVAALERGTAWPGGAGSVEDETWVVAAAGAWDDLGCVLVLYRTDEDGLDHDVHVALRQPSGACVGVLCSRQVERLHLVHRSPTRGLVREQTIAVPPSGLVAFACPVVHHTDSVLVHAVGVDGARLSEETHWPLTDIDRHWPDESLWTGYEGW